MIFTLLDSYTKPLMASNKIYARYLNVCMKRFAPQNIIIIEDVRYIYLLSIHLDTGSNFPW